MRDEYFDKSGNRAEERTVVGDANDITELLKLAPSQAERTKVPENEVVVRPRGLELVPTRNELLAEGRGVGNDLFRVRLPCGLARLEEGGRDTGNRLQVIIVSTSRQIKAYADARCCGGHPGKRGRQRR